MSCYVPGVNEPGASGHAGASGAAVLLTDLRANT